MAKSIKKVIVDYLKRKTDFASEREIMAHIRNVILLDSDSFHPQAVYEAETGDERITKAVAILRKMVHNTEVVYRDENGEFFFALTDGTHSTIKVKKKG